MKNITFADYFHTNTNDILWVQGNYTFKNN